MRLQDTTLLERTKHVNDGCVELWQRREEIPMNYVVDGIEWNVPRELTSSRTVGVHSALGSHQESTIHSHAVYK